MRSRCRLCANVSASAGRRAMCGCAATVGARGAGTGGLEPDSAAPSNQTAAGIEAAVLGLRQASKLSALSPTVRPLCRTSVSYTHLRAHETGRNLVCRLLLEKKKNNK